MIPDDSRSNRILIIVRAVVLRFVSLERFSIYPSRWVLNAKSLTWEGAENPYMARHIRANNAVDEAAKKENAVHEVSRRDKEVAEHDKKAFTL